MQNQVVYNFEKSIYKQIRVFSGLKKFLASTLTIVGSILFDKIISERSKIWKFSLI